MTPAQEYVRLLRESRRAQLAHDGDAVHRLHDLLTRAAADLSRAIRQTPHGIGGARYRRALMTATHAALDGFRGDYKTLLDTGIMRAAQIAADREQALARIFAPEASARFGEVPHTVLETRYARVYSDGLSLADRLDALDRNARRALGDLTGTGLEQGQSARDLAEAIGAHLTQAGVDNLRYQALRIARTEISSAFRAGHLASVTDADGKLKSYINAIGWRLSASHPRIDICDSWAGDDNGFGPGNYQPGDVPPGHPHCRCYTVSILTSMPDQQFVAKVPRPQDVPESQRRYYDRPAPEIRLVQGSAAGPEGNPSGRTLSLTQVFTHVIDAEKWLRQQGINTVDYGGNLQVANLANEAMRQLKAKKIPQPLSVHVDPSRFTKYGSSAVQIPAMTVDARLILNPGASYWQNPEAEVSAQFIRRWWSSDNPLHPIFHEAGHFGHYRKDHVRYNKTKEKRLTDTQRDAIDSAVSGYAASDGLEFLSETLAKLMDGQPVNAKVLKLYRDLGGIQP